VRYRSVAFLALLAAHGPLHHHSHHPMLSNWHMGGQDGSAFRESNRSTHRFATDESLFAEHHFNRVELGNGANVGAVFVGGRHMGLRLKLPF
jgi:hypothetical protein